MPWGDDARRFLARVHSWPASDADAGLVNVHSRWPSKDPKKPNFFTGKAFRNVDELMGYVKWLQGQADARDIYHCTSLQAQTTTNRKGKVVALRNIHNTLTSKVLAFDIDVKPPPKGYATRNEALLALAAFCKTWKLPLPTAIVGSGGGLHCYWVSDRPMAHAEWQPLAEKLRAAGVHSGLRFDQVVTIDMTRLLRIPETGNWKTNPPLKVELLRLAPTDFNFDTQIKPALDAVPPLALVKSTVTAPVTPAFDPKLFAKRAVPASYAAAVGEASAGIEFEAPPLDVKAVLKGCGFLRETLRSGGVGNDQPLWNLSTLAATFMGDKGRKIAHAMSDKHTGYNTIDTDSLFDRKEVEKRSKDMGWPSCGAIEQAGCKECALCPHRGKIRSPLNLGTVVRAAPAAPLANFTAAGNAPIRPEVDPWPVALPDGYSFNAAGVICKIENRKEKDADGNVEVIPTMVPLLNDQRMFMPWVQHEPDAIYFTVDGSVGGLRKVYIEREFFTSHSDTKKVLGRQGVAFNAPMQNHIGDFLMDLMRTIELKKQAARAKPFGWLDLVTKGDCDTFVYGGKSFHRDGSETPGGYMDEKMTNDYGPVGSKEPYLKAAAFILSQNIMPNTVSLAIAFGAPLMEFTGQHIGVYSVFGISGGGKTTGMKVGGSVWGHPEDSRITQKSTENHVGHKMGVLANLPVIMDEVTEEKSQESLFNQMMQDGKERERLIARNGLPMAVRQSGKWYTICGTTSNRSFLGFLSKKQKDTNAGRYRVFEVELNQKATGTADHWDVDKMVGDLRGNFGVVGLEYAKFLAVNSAGLRERVIERGKAFDAIVGARQEERFWSAFCVCVLLGAEFAKQNGWVDFDLPALEAYLVKSFLRMRQQMDEAGQDNLDATIELVTAFIKENRQHLIITDSYSARAGRVPAPFNILVQPQVQFSKGIYVQFVDRAIRPVLMLSRREIGDWLVKADHQASLVMGRIPHKVIKSTLARGTQHAGGQERLYEIDISPSGANSWLYNVMKDLEGKSGEEVSDDIGPQSAEQIILTAAQDAISKDRSAG